MMDMNISNLLLKKYSILDLTEDGISYLILMCEHLLDFLNKVILANKKRTTANGTRHFKPKQHQKVSGSYSVFYITELI